MSLFGWATQEIGLTFFDDKSIIVSHTLKPTPTDYFITDYGSGGFVLSLLSVNDYDIRPRSYGFVTQVHNYEDLPREENDKYFSVIRFTPQTKLSNAVYQDKLFDERRQNLHYRFTFDPKTYNGTFHALRWNLWYLLGGVYQSPSCGITFVDTAGKAIFNSFEDLMRDLSVYDAYKTYLKTINDNAKYFGLFITKEYIKSLNLSPNLQYIDIKGLFNFDQTPQSAASSVLYHDELYSYLLSIP